MGAAPRAGSAVALPGHHTPAVGLEAPFEMLEACHERVQRMLTLMGRLQQHLLETGLDDSARQAARDVMRYFDLAAPLHHQDEELHVFPPLLAGTDAGLRNLVQGLMQDHRQMEAAWPLARAALLAVAEGPASDGGPLNAEQTDALNRFSALYAQHIQSEEDLVYPAAQAVLSPDAVQAMSADMMRRRGVVQRA
jgi:hemerythrin-like domain-containing protein